jgi:predicted TIM-barrel fold metal-dependent hydrolase
MKHGGEPWADLCVKLMLKWPNLYFATSAFAPKYYPAEIIHYANTRGSDRILFAGYWPNLAYDDVFAQLEQLPLRDHVWQKFLHDNAAKVFKVDA